MKAPGAPHVSVLAREVKRQDERLAHCRFRLTANVSHARVRRLGWTTYESAVGAGKCSRNRDERGRG